MRRAFRVTLAAVSLLLPLVVAAGWWQSYASPGEAVLGWRDEALRAPPSDYKSRRLHWAMRRPVDGLVWNAISVRGRLELSRVRFTQVDAEMLDHFEPFGEGRGFFLIETGAESPPPVDGSSFASEPVQLSAPSRSGGWRFQGHRVRAPFWSLALVSAIPAAVVMRRRAIRWRRARRGLCVACGYDLRASTGRCPECGRETLGATK